MSKIECKNCDYISTIDCTKDVIKILNHCHSCNESIVEFKGYKTDNTQILNLPCIMYGGGYKLTKDIGAKDDIFYLYDEKQTKIVNGKMVGTMSDEDREWYKNKVKEIN